MSTVSPELQVISIILTGLCTLISTILLLRRDRREVRESRSSVYRDIERIRKGLRHQIVDVLHSSLIPIRGIYLHLGDGDRLRSELELVLSKPHVEQTLTDLFTSLHRAETHSRNANYIRMIQLFCLTVGTSSLVGGSLLFTGWLASDSDEFHIVNWIMIALVVIAAIIYAMTIALKTGLNHRLNAMLGRQEGASRS